jgi:vacuolar-type H+-ATPase subunit F/Vma7
MTPSRIVEESSGMPAPPFEALVAAGSHHNIFVDEGLAGNNAEAIARLNENPRPAIILLPNPAQPKGVAAANLQQLMVRAIGSDIFS